MSTYIYDGTFEGLFSAIFEVYDRKDADVNILSDLRRQDNLFGETIIIHTDKINSDRVLRGLKKKISKDSMTKLYLTFCSEYPVMENKILSFVRYVFSNTGSVENNYANDAVRFIHDAAKKVHREKHRMEAFVRFKQTRDDLYYAIVAPDFNVLPLISLHFTKRYADQRWMIYDEKRKYGLFYDLHSTQMIEVDFVDHANYVGSVAEIFDETETLYQDLWRNYFDSVNIKARKNPKLHIRHMPKRYWRNLVEKRGRTQF